MTNCVAARSYRTLKITPPPYRSVHEKPISEQREREREWKKMICRTRKTARSLGRNSRRKIAILPRYCARSGRTANHFWRADGASRNVTIIRSVRARASCKLRDYLGMHLANNGIPERSPSGKSWCTCLFLNFSAALARSLIMVLRAFPRVHH